MAKQIAFNTRRCYSDKGQRIALSAVADKIYFIDFDRGIDGVVSCDRIGEHHEREIARIFMRLYDSGCYRYPSMDDTEGRAWISGIQFAGFEEFLAAPPVHVLLHFSL